MSDIGSEFTLLTVGTQRAAGSQLRTRRVAAELTPTCLVAVDASGERHFLVEAAGEAFAPDSGSRGVTITARSLILADEKDVLFVDLHCRISSLDLVFERLVEDVIERLQTGPEERPEIVCRAALAEWRALLKSAISPMSREAIVGLAGELEVLKRLIGDPGLAVEAWTGPSGAIHDFSLGGAELEVKTTPSVDGNFIQVSNLDQLDPDGVSQLHLVVVHLRADSGGLTLDDRINELLHMGAPRDLLLEKAASAGFVFESGMDDAVRYSVRSVRVWEVDGTFPGIRREDLGARAKGVSHVSYELALDVAPSPIDDADDFLEAWARP